MENNEIASRVMLATLNISTWYARSFDNKATTTVEHQHNVPGVGRFNKRLLPQKADEYASVKAIENRMRKEFYHYSLEYDQHGVRLMPVSVYLDFAEKMRVMTGEFDAATKAFVAAYPELKERAKEEQKDLYSSDDYPSNDVVGLKFGVRFSVLPFPDARHFGIELPAEYLDSIRKDMDDRVTEAISAANSDLMNRLFKSLTEVTQRLNTGNGVRLDLLTHLREVLEQVPRLNFMGDEMLNNFVEQTKDGVAKYSTAAIKESNVLRSEVTERANDLQRIMAAYMGADPTTPAVPMAFQLAA